MAAVNGWRTVVSALTTMVLLSVTLASPGQAAPSGPDGAAGAAEQSAEEAASVAAEASGERVEVVASRTESQQVYANPDGSFTMELTTGPTLVPKGNGWVEPDSTLVRRADGTIAPVATANPVVFSGGGSTAPLVRLSRWDQALELRWPDPLPSPTLSGDTATYAGVLPDVDLQLTAHTQGFSPVLVVKTPEAADNPRLAEVEFGLDTQKLTVTEEPDGGLAARNDAGDVVFESSRVEMSDAPASLARAADEPADEPTEEPTVGALQSVGEVKLTGDELTLIPDQELLDDPKANYPVRIDPYWSAPGNAWAKVMSGKPDSAYWFGGLDGDVAKAGYCGWGGCNGVGAVRSYFQYDTGALAGAQILGAEFNVRENYAPSCGARPVELWRTNPIGPGTTWRAQPGAWSIPDSTRNVAYGYSASCGANWLGFNVTGALSPGGLTTFMLKGANENGNDADAKYGWKKFDSFASRDFSPRLIVTYNWPPDVPSSLWARAGQGPNLGCPGDAEQAFSYSARPSLLATLTDKDGQNLAARFEWWNYGGGVVGSAQTAAQPSGTVHGVTIPSGAFGDGRRISWRVQAWDGTAWSPWSRFCQITVDTTKPGRPTVTSTDYPENGVGGYVGKTGTFTVRPAGNNSDVIGFQWSLNFQDFPAVNLDSPQFARVTNGVATIQVTPLRVAPQELYVRAVDRALNVSEPYQKQDSNGGWVPGGYHFLVGTAVPPPVGHWPLDGDYHATPRNAAPDVSGNNRNATVSGADPATSAAWTFGRDREALRLSGAADGYATTGSSAVDTNRTFSVSAWVMLDRQDTGSYAAVSQDGNTVFGFFLGYVGDDQRFTFRMVPQDSEKVYTVRALSTGPPLAGVWYHLTGVFDVSGNQLLLYVNGKLEGSASMPTSWDANGALQIGRDYYNYQYRENWPGRIDDVRVWDRRLADTEIQALANTPALEEAFYPLDEGTGTRVGDISGNYRYATVSGNPAWRPGPVGDHALELDGVDDAVTGSQQAVRTDGSFAVTARARLDPTGTNATQTVVSQDGPNTSGFVLRRGSGNKWEFGVYTADDTGQATMRVVESAGSAVPGNWVNLAGVYDAATGEIRLYVDGVEQKASARVTAHVPGTIVIGRSKQAGAATAFFDGRVDDVHLYTGVRTEDQITAENVNPITARPNPYAGQLSRFVNHDGRHFASTGPVPPGTLIEGGFGLLAPPDARDTRVLYSCNYNGGWFTSTSDTCEGNTVLGEIGRLYKNPPADRPSLPIHRCVVPANGDHYITTNDKCENAEHRFEGTHGYTLAYRYLVRYVSDAPPHDHLTTITLGHLPSGYQPEGTQGMLALTNEPGTRGLYSCVEGTDEFLATDATCGGKTVRNWAGGIWDAPPDFAADSAPLFLCRTESGDRYSSFDQFCEDGAPTQGSRLGYVITRL